jgi:hypothetical protein
MSDNRPRSQVIGAKDYTFGSQDRKMANNQPQSPSKSKRLSAPLSSYTATPLLDLSKPLPDNVILTDALADVIVTGQAEGGSGAPVQRPVVVHAAPNEPPDTTIAEIEQRLQTTFLDPSGISLNQFGSPEADRPRASAILSDTLHLRNGASSRPVSELYIPEPEGMGKSFGTDIMDGINSQNGQYLRPESGMDFDQEGDRPRTAASGDTYQKAQTLFTDFDGMHYAPSVSVMEPEESVVGSRLSSASILMAPPMMNKSVPPPAPGMVFYPAPVPRTLMLPQRLSRAMPAHEQAKRRSQMLTALPADARKSAIWLNKQNPILEGESEQFMENPQLVKQRMSMLPPQLRASMFFENPSTLQEVEIKDRSAVATLDDILDASTVAPVSAFTDHPFAGKVGGNVYKKEHKRKTSKGTPPKKEKSRSSFMGLRRTSISSADALNDTPKLRKQSSRAFSLGAKLDDAALSRDASGAIVGTGSGTYSAIPGDGDEEEGEDEEEDYDEEDDPDFDMPSDDEDPFARVGPPTTLLAELQYRKAAQKQRNRTALTAFPNGMHSTLLEMDAVAQVQRTKRQNARTILAWEDPDRAKAQGFGDDDDDVPLGVLQAAKGANKDKPGVGDDWDRPMGLIELREREDNEPLAVRKARLRANDPYSNHRNSHLRTMSGPLLHLNGDMMEDEPEETLAQRAQRLKNQGSGGSSDGARPHSQAFSEELLGQFDRNSAGSKENLAPEEEEEETLGQRRARLQREAQSGSPQSYPVQPALRPTTSMADLLQNIPIGATRRVSDKNLVSNLPQDSLLHQSEQKKAAHRNMMDGIRNAQRTPSGGYSGQPLVDLSNVDMTKNGIGPNGYRGSQMNVGYGGMGGMGGGAMASSMVDLRQSMQLIAQQNQMALEMMQQNQMLAMQGMPPMGMDPRMSMQMGMAPMAMPPMMHTAPRMSMNPYGQPAMGAFASTPNLMGGMAHPGPLARASTMNPMVGMAHPGMPMRASTTNLMGGMAMPQAAPMTNPDARSPSLMGMPMAAPELFVDDVKKSRIENWRQEIPME